MSGPVVLGLLIAPLVYVIWQERRHDRADRRRRRLERLRFEEMLCPSDHPYAVEVDEALDRGEPAVVLVFPADRHRNGDEAA